MATAHEIRVAIFKLASVFPRELTEPGIQVYTEMLSELTTEQLAKSLHKCLIGCKFFPSISEILEYAETNTDAELSELFWACIDGKIEMPKNLSRAFTSIGGIEELKKLKTDKLIYLKKDFLENAKIFARNEKEQKLIGFFGEQKCLQ